MGTTKKMPKWHMPTDQAADFLSGSHRRLWENKVVTWDYGSLLIAVGTQTSIRIFETREFRQTDFQGDEARRLFEFGLGRC